MKSSRFGLIFAAAFIGCVLSAVAPSAVAQRTSSPQRSGGSISPDRTVLREKRQRAEAAKRERATGNANTGGPFLTASLTPAGDQWKYYSGIAQLLGQSESDLRSEYEAQHKKVLRLQPKHFFAAKLLAQTAVKEHPGAKVTDKEIVAGLAKGVSPLQFLIKRGLTDGEAARAYDEAMRELESAHK